MTIILLRFMLTELNQMSESIKGYFKSWDNWIDILFISTMGSYIAINMIF